MTLDQIIELLHLHGHRATYGALGEYFGYSSDRAGWVAGTWMSQRPQNHLNSWVVLKDKGYPAYPSRAHIDPRLWDSPPAMETGPELTAWIAQVRNQQ